jgi:pilus assembly protein CpaF
MALLDRLDAASQREDRDNKPSLSVVSKRQDGYQELKSRIHRELIDRLDLSRLDDINPDDLEADVRYVVEDLIQEEDLPLNMIERERLVTEIQHETFGLGPLEPLMHDPDITDILVNGSKQLYVERFGKLEHTDVFFKDDHHLRQIIDRIVSNVGRRVDEACPMVDARLQDGSRVNAIIPPLALNGPILSIRRFGVEPYKMNDLLSFKTLTQPMVEFLQGAVKVRQNILISGGTGSGKTTLLNVLSSFIPGNERIITIEDAAELQMQQQHVVRLETRPPSIEGTGEVTQRQLVINALRMRPDRIIVGEVRGGEALDMLQAMNTGHDGSLSTIHANSPRDALSRLQTMILMSGFDLPVQAMREQIASAINIIIQVCRLSDGTRKIAKISEIVGLEGNTIVMQDIFVFEQKGINEHSEVLGEHVATGVRPKCFPLFYFAGIDIDKSFFDIRE